ncbi:hypothetical protein BRADI_1g74506v3 [Brachypodium distachyon]|uniref:Uncharacterized protein n=1 Tax=Brachypodium distachyon TaxID=15368 RepID=A0A2K2DV54_BRADI|nr:hypothetical protein BRADI_1g74506v3 [Brachypodium distachyon]
MACKTTVVIASILLLALLMSCDTVQCKCKDDRTNRPCHDSATCDQDCRLEGNNRGYCDAGLCHCVDCGW